MSAWLCGNKTLSLVADVILSKEFQENYDTKHDFALEKSSLVNLLSYLNTKSLNARYGENKELNVLEDIEYVLLDVGKAQKHKSVRCYLYQTCESDECCEHPLFQLLEQWSEDNYEKYSFLHKYCEWDMDSPILTEN